MRLPLASLSVVSVLAFFAFASPLALADEWTEPGGGPGRTRSVDELRAPLTAPVERWRMEFDELLGEPVSSSGTIYVVGRKGKKSRIYMLDTETGEELDSVAVSSDDFGHVSVLGTTVVVVTPGALYHFERRGDSLKRAKTIRDTFSSPAALAPQLVFVFKDTTLCAIDLRSYRVMHEFEGTTGKPSVHVSGSGATVFVSCDQNDAARQVVGVRELQVSNLGSKDMGFRDLIGTTVPSTLSPDQRPEVVVMAAEGGIVNYLAAGSRPVRTSEGAHKRYFYGGPAAKHSLPVLDKDACFASGKLFGRTIKDAVVQANILGGGVGVIAKENRPEGAVDGPITAAGGVLMLGNWALETASARILWVAPDMEFEGPLIPVADGMVMYTNGHGALICAGDVNAGAGDGLTTLRPELPGAAPEAGAVILFNGQRFPGKAALADDGTVTLVASEGEEPQSFGPGRVSAIEAEGKLTVLDGDSYAVLLAGRAALDRAYAEDLAEVAERYAKRRLVADARRLLEEAEVLGLPESAARELAATLSGKGENTAGNRDKQRVAGQETEAKARKKGLVRVLDFSKWCMDQGLALEGTAALALVPDYVPGRPALRKLDDPTKAMVVALATPHIPEEFSPHTTERSALEWIAWANALAPSGARFVDADAVIDRKRAAPIDGQPRPEVPASEIWRKHTLALQTQNIVLLTRSQDPEIVGACLTNGEGAVRTLERVLDNPPMADDERMEVRIHKTRKDYLAEDFGDGSRVSEWSLGFYMPSLRASRFHVPDGTAHGSQGRALHEVVAHELTHQYIAERWRRVAGGKRTVTTPGFWIVEGFARFIEDQSLEMSRRGDAMDDHTVQSVESVTQLLIDDAGIRLKDLFRINQVMFHRDVTEEPICEVKLKSKLVLLTHTGKTAFYDEAATLVFFMMNRAGPEGRLALLNALESHYKGETAKNGWRALGFKTVESMEHQLKAFLKSPQTK